MSRNSTTSSTQALLGRASGLQQKGAMLSFMQAEVFSDDLSKLHFFQKNTHPETLEKYLDPSHYIRQCMLEMARTLGLTSASIKRRLLHLFEEDKQHPTPFYRRPDATQVNNVVNNSRRKDRLLSDPLLSIGVFAELNPDKVFRYTEPNTAQNPPSGFSTGIHHPYGTQSMLLWSSVNGVGHDSTYRHMNENRAPLTIVDTLDDAARMVPGFAYLSSDTTTPTQVTFLQEVKRLVEQMARDLVEGKVEVVEGLKDHANTVMKQAHLICRHGWKPAFFMIDKYRPAKNAIRQVFPGVAIPGRNRDNMLSTNNWTERAFKTFNQVFLGNRNNKPIYRLVLILANEWFQYYQAWKPRKQFDQKVFKINAEGHRLWSCEGAVQQFVMDDGRTAWRVASTN
ncbi:hypothetical protein K438DRAFT_628804 [Mycena galopus ATCC 62051]|nr:hypothetical protein K438DRAFT_628804 [Mycena galopus ATCC 62051]